MKSNMRMSALSAWKLQLGLLPLGIITFVLTLTGVVLGLSLSIIGIGIPILAGTLAWSAARMKQESHRWSAWRAGAAIPDAPVGTEQTPSLESATAPRSSWSAWFKTLSKPIGYRAAAHQLFGFPVRIALFVIALVVPVTVFAIMLAPAVYKVSDYLYGYVLFEDATMNMLLPPLTPFERSLVVSGIGIVLMLFVPALLRACGRAYAAWLEFFAGHADAASTAAPTMPQELPEVPAAAPADDWLARAEAAISRYDEEVRHVQTPQAH